MIILCEYCDLRYICYEDWMEHLLSTEHQNVISKAINCWDLPLNERSLVVTINGTKPEKTDICWYFASYGLVSDAFFEPDLEFCVIQLDKKDYAANAMAVKHSIESANLSLRLKSDISDAEWIQLNRMGRRNSVENIVDRRKELKESFEDRHSKLSKTLTTLAIDTQMEIFERETRMSSSEFNLRQNLLKDINRLFNMDYPNCILCPYGSFVTGLGDKSSVLHMYFDAIGLSAESAVNERRYQGMLPPKKEIMESLGKCIGRINQKQLFCHDFVVLPRDVPPCIQFTHYATGVTCRFTFESLLPIQTSKLISLVMKLDSRLPALFLFARYWGKYYKISGPKLITSYSLNLLLLVFLTTKKIIPSIAALLSMGNDMKEINGWETGFCDDKEKIVNVSSFLGVSSSFATNDAAGKPTAKSILELAVDFFKMYAHTDLQSQVVCSAIGDFLPKSAFQRGKETNLPKGLEAYKTRILIQKRRLDTNSLLCIQDPFDLMSNVSSSTPDDVIWKFQFLCADTIDNIKKVLKSPDLNLMDIFNLEVYKIKSTPTPTAMSASTSQSYIPSENQSGNGRSGMHRLEGPLLTSRNASYGTSHTRQEESSYSFQQQTRDVTFPYEDHRSTLHVDEFSSPTYFLREEYGRELQKLPGQMQVTGNVSPRLPQHSPCSDISIEEISSDEMEGDSPTLPQKEKGQFGSSYSVNPNQPPESAEVNIYEDYICKRCQRKGHIGRYCTYPKNDKAILQHLKETYPDAYAARKLKLYCAKMKMQQRKRDRQKQSFQ